MQLTLWYVVFFLLTVIALSLVSYFLLAQSMRERNREIVQTRAQEYRAWLEEGGVDVLKERFYRDLVAIQESLFVRILGPGQKVLFFSMPASFSNLNPDLLPEVRPEGGDSWSEVWTRDNQQAWIVSTTVLGESLILQVGMSVTQTQRILSYYRLLLWIGVLPVSLLGILGGWWFAYYSLRPVRHLREILQRIIEKGDMGERVQTGSHRGELGELALLTNRLLEKNDQLVQAMRDSLDRVAHDLKTPMTRLRSSAEVAMQSPNDVAAAREALSDCMEESDQVLSMLDIFMDLAEAQGGSMRLDLNEVRVQDLIQSVASLYEMVAEEQGVTLRFEMAPELKILVDRRRMQQAIANLVDNAVKYSRPGGQVVIRTWEQDEQFHIAVIDGGIGISEVEISKIWERLYRGTEARYRRGLGLGLSLVKAIVEAHGGTVTVLSTLHEGSTFTVKLPRTGSRPAG